MLLWDDRPNPGDPHVIQSGADASGLAFSPDGKYLASGGKDPNNYTHRQKRVIVRETRRTVEI